MPLARIGQTLLFFAHIPKTGGTSVESYLRAKGKLALHFTRSRDWLPCSPQHMHSEIFGPMLRRSFYDAGFTILRAPVARLKSEYRYRVGHWQKRGQKITPMDEWVPRILQRFEANPYVLDNHIRPQVQFVARDMKLFRLEDGMDRVFDWIDEVTGDTGPAPRAWEKNLSDIPVEMSPDTEALVREFYAEDYRLWENAGG